MVKLLIHIKSPLFWCSQCFNLSSWLFVLFGPDLCSIMKSLVLYIWYGSLEWQFGMEDRITFRSLVKDTIANFLHLPTRPLTTNHHLATTLITLTNRIDTTFFYYTVFENQWSFIYVVNWHFARYLEGCWECCHNLAPFGLFLPCLRAFLRGRNIIISVHRIFHHVGPPNFEWIYLPFLIKKWVI